MMHLLRLAHAKLRAAVRRARSPRWKEVERAHLQEHPLCEACGTSRHVQVHHRYPVHLFPRLELDPENLISLCMDLPECHLRIGHGGDWRAWNPNVERDAHVARMGGPFERDLVQRRAMRNRLTS